jgi:hypothetical protein
MATSRKQTHKRSHLLLPFGRYRGHTVAEVAAADPDYGEWLLGETWFKRKHGELFAELEALLENGEGPVLVPSQGPAQRQGKGRAEPKSEEDAAALLRQREHHQDELVKHARAMSRHLTEGRIGPGACLAFQAYGQWLFQGLKPEYGLKQVSRDRLFTDLLKMAAEVDDALLTEASLVLRNQKREVLPPLKGKGSLLEMVTASQSVLREMEVKRGSVWDIGAAPAPRSRVVLRRPVGAEKSKAAKPKAETLVGRQCAVRVEGGQWQQGGWLIGTVTRVVGGEAEVRLEDSGARVVGSVDHADFRLLD